MASRILMVLDHSIEEHDMLRLHHENGYEVASLGGYIDPAHPHDDKRPALPQVPMVQVVKDAVDLQGQPDNLLAAKVHIPDAVLDWADTIIWHHNLQRLYAQWPRIRDWMQGGRRVIWRTVGQSVDGNEHDAQPFRADGMEIVRYSPKERNIPFFAGEDALIRFGKDPAEWYGWTGEQAVVGNLTQHLKQRDDSAKGGADWTNYRFWQAATEGLPTLPAGPGSEEIGGRGSLGYDDMRAYLRRIRCYLYTGTQPASYTLGLVEAMMTGVPVVSIGPSHMTLFPYVNQMFEGHRLTLGEDDPQAARRHLQMLLTDADAAQIISESGRGMAIQLFGIDKIRAEWKAYLG
jgi:hypothetical protein